MVSPFKNHMILGLYGFVVQARLIFRRRMQGSSVRVLLSALYFVYGWTNEIALEGHGRFSRGCRSSGRLIHYSPVRMRFHCEINEAVCKVGWIAEYRVRIQMQITTNPFVRPREIFLSFHVRSTHLTSKMVIFLIQKSTVK